MKKLKIFFIIGVCIAIIVSVSVVGVNAYVKAIGGKKIITPETATELADADCIIVLGCGVDSDGRPSYMLADRLKRGIELYKQGVAPKILMSGDHGRVSYDEVNTMKQILSRSQHI